MIVSVTVISYNSSATIIDTLESIVSQSVGANNIELIVSDDYSSDDTLKKIEKWISEFGGMFYSTRVISSDRNTGVSSNINRELMTRIAEQSWKGEKDFLKAA